MMEIREGKKEDFPRVGMLLEECHKEAVEVFGLKYSKELVQLAMEEHYKQAIVLVADGEVVGVIAGKIVNYPLQNGLMFQEMIWYVTKKYRTYGVKLLRALEAKCKAEGIQILIMVAGGATMKKKLDQLYKIMGYQELETHYIKVIE